MTLLHFSRKAQIVVRHLAVIVISLFGVWRLILYGLGRNPDPVPGEWWLILSVVNYWLLRSLAQVIKAGRRFQRSLVRLMYALAAAADVTTSLLTTISSRVDEEVRKRDGNPNS